MKLRRLDHSALLVSDVERARAFYGGALGMEEMARPESFTFPGAWFRSGDTELHLIGEEEAGRAQAAHPGYREDEVRRGYGAHLGFEVDDLDAATARLAEHEVDVVGPPRDRGDGAWQMYVRDPDGYIVELIALVAVGAEGAGAEAQAAATGLSS